MVDFANMFGFGEPELEENQEQEHVSYGEKLSDACCGMCIGFVLFFGCLGLSAWNEFRNVATQKTITAASREFKEGSCVPIMSELEGELVHITCPVSNLQVLGDLDPVLRGIPEQQRVGLSLESYMEVYQWDEHVQTTTKEDKVGGGTTKTKTYTYSRIWSTFTPPDVTTSFFKQGESCKTQNGGYACLNWDPSVVENWWSASRATLGTKVIDESDQPKAGDYYIPKDQLNRLGSKQILTPTCTGTSTGTGTGSSGSTTTAPGASTTTAPAATTAPNNNTTTRNLQSSSSSSGNNNVLSCSPGGDAILKGSKLYWQQQDSNQQMIDYLSRSYSLRTTDTVSILAMQTGNTFASWTSPYDDDYYVYEVVDGNLTADQMLEDLEAANVGMTWFLRFLTLLLTIVGLVMITAPLATIPDIIPCVGPWVGDLIGSVLWAVDCALGCCCWCFITAIAWITYRPIIGIPLLCCSCCLCAGGGFLAYKNHQIKQIRLNAEAEMAKKKKAEEEDGYEDEEEQKVDKLEVAEEYNPDYMPEQSAEPAKE